jgi:ATP-dependent DNA ligase
MAIGLIVRRDGPTVRLYSRNAYDWTARLSAIATAAQRIKAKSFTKHMAEDGPTVFGQLASLVPAARRERSENWNR